MRGKTRKANFFNIRDFNVELRKELHILSIRTGKKVGVLAEEGITDLLKKYNKGEIK